MNLPLARLKPYVLVTGATGMVGSHILARLLARQVPVAVLVRDAPPTAGQRSVAAADRIERLLERFEARWNRHLKRPVVLSGDINAAGLGLSGATRRWLASHCGSVIHSAASLSFRPASESPDHEPYRTNVDATAALAAVCADLAIVDFHYISTAYVCGLRGGRVSEFQTQCGQSFANDYEHSKLQAEQLLRAQRCWRQLTIYRPSIVIDSTGLATVSQDRTIYSAFAMFYSLAAKFGLPEPGTWSRNIGLSGVERKNVVEAAWIAETVAGIFEDPQLHGRTYHLTSRTGTSTSQMELAFHEVTAQSLASQGGDASDPADARTERDGSLRSLRSGSAALAGRDSGPSILDAIAAPFVEAYQAHFRDDPVFERENIDAALRRLALPEQAPIDADALAAMIRVSGCTETKSNPPAASTPLRKPVLATSGTPAATSGTPAATSGTPAATSGTPADESAAEVAELGEAAQRPAGSSADWGVLICGPGGGDYRIGGSGDGRRSPGGESCSRRIYLASVDWYSLVRGDCEVEELITAGRLLLESDAQAGPSLDEMRGFLNEFISRVAQEQAAGPIPDSASMAGAGS